MKKIRLSFLIAFLLPVWCFAETETGITESDSVTILKLQNYIMQADRDKTPSVDHGSFPQLKKEFKNAHEVTQTCLSCHTGRAAEVMKTNHWMWERTEKLDGRGEVPLGKKNILNNFCIGIAGSEKTCTRCHIGYGWEDKSFDFSNQLNVDCLICHDNSDTYIKKKGGAGYPDESVDLNYVAQSVGKPSKVNCGVCHFWGGGGNNVKHGDLEKALLNCDRSVDVHMASEGENMSCIECHTTDKHVMAGKLYALSSENKNRATCTQCHTEAPHEDELLNEHFIRIACQTCHIPTYAKANSTKMIWDWSTAGRLDENGNPMHENDADGNHNYLSIKGTFVYDNNVIPEYYWFNGIADHQLITDKIDTIPVQMNSLSGSYLDKGIRQRTDQPSKIWPVKVHRGKQIFDSIHNTLIQPKLHAEMKGDSAYWKDFDWDKAATAGMNYLGLPYSGKYGFVETEMYWPLSHMVSPKEKSLSCKDCHTRNGGRLAQLDDFYLPGRDKNTLLDSVGIALVVLAALGAIIHGALRMFYRKKSTSK
ncbi:tetrathionate reductase family octaheme c-type cytochrome [Marinifilum fragile]|uniref:tetrathionate reductase family octaheme c-type cytochrome n=1 Tax=Marinifilum fragile TaxID=570161 RepID=UPI002AA89D6D|nr:tetrathionate reductase family octaheme c-type cytochrome [Marinifilum fragile]